MDSPKPKMGKRAYQLFFSTLANETRLTLINILRQKPLNVTQICEVANLEQSLVSHHLKMLEHHGMVFKKKEGKFRYYTVNEKTIKPLLESIDAHMKEYCCKILAGKR
ncbi:winged helix-turn-helix transcriptional regulator [Candidatus Woesearchaeota archaeon]|nr:winged helix-turn-helix transcriptional regulator [Candidatus Woesearchaeota archaeon]